MAYEHYKLCTRYCFEGSDYKVFRQGEGLKLCVADTYNKISEDA
jgi:hypothetical protein